MISMTGFGKEIYTDEQYDIEIIIKSVNSRFFDLRQIITKEYSELESLFLKRVSKHIPRGKIDLRVTILNRNKNDIHFNKERFDFYLNLICSFKKELNKEINIDLKTIINDDLLFRSSKKIDDHDKELFLDILEKAIEKFLVIAKNEGEKMKASVEKSISLINNNIEHIEKFRNKFKTMKYNQLKKNIENLLKDSLTEDDMRRILLETAIYVEKADINEEIIRMNTHLDNFKRTLDSKEKLIGKKMNFLLQEMHREITTLGTKMNFSDTATNIVSIKEEIEKIREIVQNVR